MAYQGLSIEERVDALVKYLSEEKNLELVEEIKNDELEENQFAFLMKDIDGNDEILCIAVSKYDNMVLESSYGEFLTVNDNEANDVHQESLENVIDDIGLEAFSPFAKDYILENCINNSEWFEEHFEEDTKCYYEDIANEGGNKPFESRQQEELFEILFENLFPNADIDKILEAKDNISGIKDDIEELENEINNLEEERNDLEIELDDIQSEIDNLQEEKDNLEDENEINKKNDEILKLENKFDLTDEKIADLNLDIEIKNDELSELQDKLYNYEADFTDEIQEFFIDYDRNVDDYIEQAVEKRKSEENSFYEWFEFNFGKDAVADLLKDGQITLDIQAVSEYVISIDGRAGELARYDGKEEYVVIENDTVYIYKIDDTELDLGLGDNDREIVKE